MDVRLAAENVLAEFLREIKYIAQVQDKQAENERATKEAREIVESKNRRLDPKMDQLSKMTPSPKKEKIKERPMKNITGKVRVRVHGYLAREFW